MFSILKWIGSGLVWIGGAIMTPVANLRKANGIGRIMRGAVHAVAMMLILAGLTFVNYWFQLDSLLRTPLPLLRYIWLPLMFALVYSLFWLGWYVCRSLAAEKDTPHEDIDTAWKHAVSTLNKAGVDITTTPLYLIVGGTHGETHDLIRAAGIPLLAPPTPPSDHAPPLQVFANREAIYVSCNETSLIGRQAKLLALAPEVGVELPAEGEERKLDEGDVDLHEMPWEAGGSGGGTATATALRTEKAPASTGLSLMEQSVAQLAREFDPELEASFSDCLESTELDPLTRDLEAALLHDAAEIERTQDRLEHLCHVIAEERHPHVPIQAVLTVAPAAATDKETVANHVGEMIRRDLETIHAALQVECPHVLLISDLERTPGAKDLLQRFPPEQKQRRLGVRLPDLVREDFANIGSTIDSATEWLIESLLTPLAYRLIRAPLDDENEADVVRGNAGIYRFLYRMRRRSDRIAILLRRMAAGDGHDFRMPTACYLVANGRDASRDHAFAEAVFTQLPQFTSTLRWTDRALRANRRRLLIARAGLFGLAATVLVAASAVILWQ